MKKLNLYILFAAVSLLAACEKEIQIDLPEYEKKIVVEGSIEQGQPPLVFLSWSSGYFDPVDASTYENSFIHGANVTMTTDQGTINLPEICTSSLPPGMDTIIAEFLGVPVSQLAQLPICAYTTIDTSFWGKTGQNYSLTVEHDTFSLSSNTQIPNIVNLDSIWYEVQGNMDTLGFIFARLTDPDTVGNGYRWFTRRLTTNENGFPEDPQFNPPFGSAFDDKFFNGQSFDFGFQRPGSEYDSDDDEPGYFKTGDTVVVRFTSITLPVMKFFRSMESQIASGGSPFASPANVKSNIEGGLGIWAGYAATYDTLICQ